MLFSPWDTLFVLSLNTLDDISISQSELITTFSKSLLFSFYLTCLVLYNTIITAVLQLFHIKITIFIYFVIKLYTILVFNI